MRSKIMKQVTKLIAIAGVLSFAGLASAEDVYLKATSGTKIIDPSGSAIGVTIWGFAECDSTFATCDAVDAPGAALDLDLATLGGDTTLTIHLMNDLDDPVSIIIPGLGGDGTPTPIPGGDSLGRDRARSLTVEVAPGDTGIYSWTMRPGTFLYQSGTAPSLQVPMGLYGSLVVRNGAEVYPDDDGAGTHAAVTPDSEVMLFLSELDPIQNDRVNAAAGGGDPTQACVTIKEFVDSGTIGYPCTIDYYPVITLVNGGATADLAVGNTDNVVLLRMLNAGQHTHVPAIVNTDLAVFAEDSYRYPGLPKQQTQAHLAAGKTLDALIDASGLTDVELPVFDRQPSYNNEVIPNGGALGGVSVGTPPTPPTPGTYAVNDDYTVIEDTGYSSGTASVLDNDVGLVGATVAEASGVSNGTLSLAPNGTFTYTPDLDFSGADAFTYTATLGTDTYNAQVTLNVSFENDAPTANDDGVYVNTVGLTVEVDAVNGVLGNDVDPDGDTLTAILDTGSGVTLNGDGSFVFTAAGPGPASFTYHVTDGTASSASATVTLDISPPSNIALNVTDPDGGAVANYRWIVQEDATYHIDPEVQRAGAGTGYLATHEQLATNFHTSYMPVIAQGCVGAGCATGNPAIPDKLFNDAVLDLDNKHYYVSVLPSDAGSGAGHTLGGAQIQRGTASGSTIDVIVNNQPIPPAQVSVIVFDDTAPTNGVPDAGEAGLGGFQILIEDAAGHYGQGPGFVQMDVDGMPLVNALGDDPDCYGGSAPPVGVVVTCEDGRALIQNLPPAKYGIIAVPRQTGPGGVPETWTQTSTIEGTKVIDTWVKAGEPPFLVEFGAPGYHAFLGFVNPETTTVPDSIPNNVRNNTITGSVAPLHSMRLPSATEVVQPNYNSLAHTRPWVGINSIAGDGPNFAAVQAYDPNPDDDTVEMQFEINGIPDGTYQLVVWDDYLDQIISFQTVVLTSPGNSPTTTEVGTIGVPTWFGRHENNVFLDLDADGVWDVADGEFGLQEQNVNLRFRDGSIFQAFPTDSTGFVPFDQIFPFGSWQVAEIDFARMNATGVSVSVDGGGPTTDGLQNPAQQYTEEGVVLTMGFQSLPGMTSLFDWGKKPYEPGENGGISGIVFYGSTRGENDPRLTVGDTWEPGIPNVKVRLYKEIEAADGGTALRLVEEVTTDSWDASLPTGCNPEDTTDPDRAAFVASSLNGEADRCYDGLRDFEQVRPGAVFDGGYAFGDLKPGAYVVEVVPPPGYEVIKEEDKNVDFGDAFGMAPAPMMMAAAMVVLPDAAMVEAVVNAEQWGLAAPECVGPDHTVPPTLSLFPGEVDTYAPYAGADRPLCTRKRVILHDQANAAADFHLFTQTPVAGQYTGLSTDDIAVDANPLSTQFGDKFGPSYMPVSQYDYNGNLLYRDYTDAYGKYDGMVPSTFSANLPIPSGYSPGMHSVCLNDPFLPDGSPDPNRLPQYGMFCYTLMYMPGLTAYLDTPMLPQSAFAAGYNPVDCALPEGYPVVTQVDGTATGPLVAAGGTLSIYAQGEKMVPNPEYEGPDATPPYNQPTITRDYSFGTTAGTVYLGDTEMTSVSWADGAGGGPLEVTIPAGFAEGEYQLVVTNANGQSSINTVTVTVGSGPATHVVEGPNAIQNAIDAAAPGDLIIVEPGTYPELVVMWKPVRLQGSGASTIINAVKLPPEKLLHWRTTIEDHLGDFDVLPGQPAGFDLLGLGFLANEEGAGISVFGKANSGDPASFAANPSRIDGFSIMGADGGGAIFVNGYAHNLAIANNNVTGNSGVMHGGIRIGLPDLGNVPAGGAAAGEFGYNTNVRVHHNSITMNGAQSDVAAGGGLAICSGTDDYMVDHNYVCGNFSIGDGGGIGHYGRSNNGVIADNQVLFNQTFNQGRGANGGGINIAGELPGATALTLGSGNVTVDSNVIQGNQAGSGHGGGLNTQLVNGEDAAASNNPGNWWEILVTNNIIVNNVAGWSGAGIALQDTANATIALNTIAHNDTTGTVGAVIGQGPQPSGIASQAHSILLNEAIPGSINSRRNFSNPELERNIIWQNRAFTLDPAGDALLPDLAVSTTGECADGAEYLDLGVLDPAFSLTPRRNILTDTTGYPGSNDAVDPEFVNAYCNTARTIAHPGPMQVLTEAEEGGNASDVRFGPLSTTAFWTPGNAPWDYHIQSTSPAIDHTGGPASPGIANDDHDVDGQVRPAGSRVDWGADEFYPPGTPPVEPPAAGTVAYSSGAFGDVPIGSTAQMTITATVSDAPVSFSAVAGPSAPFALLAETCTTSSPVAAGGTCTFDVSYSPTEPPGLAGDSLVVTSNADASPQTVDLSGTGVEAAQVEIAAATGGFSLGGGVLNFGNIGGNGNVTSTVTLDITGAADVNFGTLSLSGSGRFTKTADTCSNTTRTPPASCTFTIRFVYNGNTVRNGTVSIPHDADGPTSLSLTGQ